MKTHNIFLAKTLMVVIAIACAGCAYDRATDRTMERTTHLRDASNVLDASGKSPSTSESRKQMVRDKAPDALLVEVHNASLPDKPRDAVAGEAQYALFDKAEDALSVAMVFIAYAVADDVQDYQSCVEAAKKTLARRYRMDEIKVNALTNFCGQVQWHIQDWHSAKKEFAPIWGRLSGDFWNQEKMLTERFQGCVDVLNYRVFMFTNVFGEAEDVSVRNAVKEILGLERAWLAISRRQLEILWWARMSEEGVSRICHDWRKDFMVWENVKNSFTVYYPPSQTDICDLINELLGATTEKFIKNKESAFDD